MSPMLPMLALAPRAQLCWKPKEGRVPVMAVVVGVEVGLLLPGLWNWARAGGIQQLSEWPSIRHSWVQVSEASARAFWRFTSMAAETERKRKRKKTIWWIHQVRTSRGCSWNAMVLPGAVESTKWTHESLCKQKTVVVLSVVDPQNVSLLVKWKSVINVSFHLVMRKTPAEHLISIGIPVTPSVYLQYAMNSL